MPDYPAVAGLQGTASPAANMQTNCGEVARSADAVWAYGLCHAEPASVMPDYLKPWLAHAIL
jgi:hypothetical protein